MIAQIRLIAAAAGHRLHRLRDRGNAGCAELLAGAALRNRIRRRGIPVEESRGHAGRPQRDGGIKRQALAESEKAKGAIKASNQEKIFNSTRQVALGNPKGDVTMVEFFDYNCGYCKRALDDMLALMKSDRN